MTVTFCLNFIVIIPEVLSIQREDVESSKECDRPGAIGVVKNATFGLPKSLVEHESQVAIAEPKSALSLAINDNVTTLGAVCINSQQ